MVLLLAAVLFPSGSAGEETGPAQRVAVIISRNIRPYVEAAEGLASAVRESPKAEVQTFFLETGDGRGPADLADRLRKEGFDLWAAVGPDSAAFIWNDLSGDGATRLYCMILNPEKAVAGAEDECGIPLNIPVERQMEVISLGLPRARRLGILYDPIHNAAFVQEAGDRGAAAGLHILPLAVSSRKEISATLKRHWAEMDALWLIPDSTVISESIVQFIVRESLLRDIPVVGYNRFFYESGAALATVFDYRDLGAQAGRLALEVLSGAACRRDPPVFQVWLNRRVLAKIGAPLPDSPPPPIRWGP